jgi:predicted choloylglycine hydrolase
MLKRFVFSREDQPGEAWRARFIAGRAEAERWYLGEGRSLPPRLTRGTLISSETILL